MDSAIGTLPNFVVASVFRKVVKSFILHVRVVWLKHEDVKDIPATLIRMPHPPLHLKPL
jgi:hypothetical protein